MNSNECRVNPKCVRGMGCSEEGSNYCGNVAVFTFSKAILLWAVRCGDMRTVVECLICDSSE